MAIKITREEYEKKFGVKPMIPSSTEIPTTTPTEPKKKLLQEGGAVQQFGAGLAKGALQTFQGLGQLGLKGVKAITGKDYGTKETLFRDPTILQAKTGAEKFGKFTEQVAEFAVPGGMVAKATKGAGFLARTGARTLSSAGVATAQAGEVGKETAIAGGLEAGIPIAGKIIKPAVKFVGSFLKGTGSALSGASSEAIEQIYRNPKVALQTAKEIRKTGGANILRKNVDTVIQGVSKIKQQARQAYGKGLEQLSRVDIEPTTFKREVSKTLDEVGSVIDKGTRKLTNIEFDDPKNIKKAGELINKLANADLDGKSLRKLVDDIENAAYKTATSDERLSFNVFTRKLSDGLKKAVSSSTNKLDEINKAFSADMQLAEATEDILGNVKYKNLAEVLNTSKKLEGLFTQKGLAPEIVDDFLERIGVSQGVFKGGEAMRQVAGKTFTANTIGTNPFEIVRAFTSAIVSPKMVGRIAAYTGLGENVIKEMSEKLSPVARGAIIKLFTGNPTQEPNGQ